MLELIASLGQLLSNLGALRKLSWWQDAELAGYAIAAGAGGFQIKHDWQWAAAAAIGAIVIHLRGLIQPPPFGKAAADAAAKHAETLAKASATQPGKQSNDDIFGSHAVFVFLFFLVAAPSLVCTACSPSLISVKGGPALPVAQASACVPPPPFAFATPDPAPKLPLVKGDACAGYALCLDQKNRAALFSGIQVLENDGIYMRDFYKGQIAAYRKSLVEEGTR